MDHLMPPKPPMPSALCNSNIARLAGFQGWEGGGGVVEGFEVVFGRVLGGFERVLKGF